MPLKLNSTGGGSVTLDTPSTASAYTLTVPAITGTAVVTGSTATVSQAMLAAGVAGNGPAFYAYLATTQTGVSSTTFTKVNVATKVFDTNTNYNTSTYRFTPTVAGYYQVTGSVSFEASAANSRAFASIWRNGAEYFRGVDTIAYCVQSVATGLLYLNGSTDYIELYGWCTGSGIQFYGQPQSTYMTAALIRSA